jgi:GT2 family glycosyltransferase
LHDFYVTNKWLLSPSVEFTLSLSKGHSLHRSVILLSICKVTQLIRTNMKIEECMIKISVVIPTYQRPELLRRCLHALTKQTFSKEYYEVIVVSDGPDEITKQTVGEFSSHQFIFLNTPLKKGPAAARNFGWKHAIGILIAFTDDDTIPDRDWLNNIWQAYKGEKEIAYTGRIKVPLSNAPTDYEKNTAGLETAEFVTANCCCTKIALEKTGGFDERFSMAWREDSDLEFQLMLHQIPIVHLENALVIHPVRQAPWGVSIKEQKKGMFNALLYKKYPELYRKKIQSSPLWNYYLIVLSSLIFAATFFTEYKTVSLISFLVWFLLTASFTQKRLKNTSKKPGHVAEMIVTSICIPFISVYWQLYGAWKYRVFFF